jgi:hypothetical protein
MEPRTKKAYIILSIISLILAGVVVILAFIDFDDPILIIVPTACGVMLIIVIMWVVFVRIRQKERADFVLAKKHRPYDEDAPEYKAYDPSKAEASKLAEFCEYCEARIEPHEDVCSNCKRPRNRYAGTPLT